MGLLDIVFDFFREEDKDSPPYLCCDRGLVWEEFRVTNYHGAYSNCGICHNTYIHKLPSNIFKSDGKPKLYIQSPTGKIRHSKCGTPVKSLDFITPGMSETHEGFVPQKEKVPYCSQCEAPNQKIPLVKKLLDLQELTKNASR